MEGMYAFMARHRHEFPKDSTTFICIDTVGSPELLLLEGEGMLGIDDYPPGLLSMIHEVAKQEGIFLRDKLRFRNATDGVVALRAGYDAAMIGSVDEFKVPANYHWPTDTPENVEYSSVATAARLCLALVRRMDRGE